MLARPPAAVFPLLLTMLLICGCGLGAGPAPSAVKLLVTREFGSRVLGGDAAPKLSGQETVMSLLVRNRPVTTRFGGGFVQSVAGLAGGTRSGRRVDWFYYVNGVEAPKGAAATDVKPGDHVWWDWHDWSQTEHIPAVVGSFPEPFLNGLNGKRLPVRVECATVGSRACDTVTSRLQHLGVPAAVSSVGVGGGQTLRVLVGTWARIGTDPVAGTIAGGPRASGVYARIGAGGATFALLDQDGGVRQVLGAGSGLIAATRYGEDAPVWVVTGTDEEGVDLAARDFDGASLADRFALAVTRAGAVALPEGGG